MKTIIICALIILAMISCRPSADSVGADGSSLASVTVGNIPQDVVDHDRMVLAIEKNGSSTDYDSDLVDFSEVKFAAGETIKLSLRLLKGANPVAQTVVRAGSKCPPQSLKLRAGANAAKIAVCLAGEDGQIDPRTGRTTRTTGEPANVDLAVCVVGKNCDGDAGGGNGGDSAAAASSPLEGISGEVTKVIQDKGLYEPAQFSVNFRNPTAKSWSCRLGLEIGASWSFTSGQVIDLAGQSSTKRLAFNEENEAGQVRDITMLMDRSIERDEPQTYRLYLFECKDQATGMVASEQVVVEQGPFDFFRRKIVNQ